jgi:D-threo-aldose 1-dehydrogenase
VAEVSAPGDWSTPRTLGARGPAVNGLGLGCAPIGNLFAGVSDADASATVDASWDAGIRYFDTAPLYGHGVSERRLGRALKRRARSEYVLSTKVGRVLRRAGNTRAASVFADVGDVEPEFDFSRDGILRSFEESLVRLGTDRIDVVLVHDPDDHEDEALRHAFPTLLRLRDEGVVKAIGCGMNQTAMLERFVARVDLDCILLAGRFSLLDRSGAELLAQCAARRIGVILGGVFNTGVLIDPDAHPTYDYAPAPPAVMARARHLQAACEARGVALGAAALQFAMRHPAVTTVLVGARSAAEVDLDVVFAASPIGDDLFAEML